MLWILLIEYRKSGGIARGLTKTGDCTIFCAVSGFWELLGGGGEVGEDEVGELEDVVAFFEAEGEVGLLAGGRRAGGPCIFPGRRWLRRGEIRLGEGEADAVFFLGQLRHAQGGGAGAEQGDGDEVRDALWAARRSGR